MFFRKSSNFWPRGSTQKGHDDHEQKEEITQRPFPSPKPSSFNTTFSKIATFFSLVVHLISTIYRYRKKLSSILKPITKRRRRETLGVYLVHLFPIAATTVLLS
jgi:hypothetical protein